MRSAPIAYLLNTGHGWGGIRRAQDKICRTIKNTSLTVITDCGNKKNIHPTDKKTVGERLADNTLKDIYGVSGYNGNGARLRDYEIICRNGQPGILLHFDGAEEGFYGKWQDCEGAAHQDELVSRDGCEILSGTGFEIGNGTGKQALEADIEKAMYYPARAQILGGDIFIYNPQATEPVCARYGNDNYFRPIFLDKKGRPIVPFGYDEYVLADKMYRHGNEVIMRVGMGYDVHRLVPDRDLIIGGVKIPYEKGLLGHSDADVLLHAIMDALLGAAALGDIGKHFPDNDPEYEGADSLALLKRVGELLSEEGYVIENIDSTIIAQKPKMAPHIEQMRKNIADTLGLDITRVNVKATTEEGLGFTGTGEGISSQAVVLIMSVENYIYDNIARGQFISSDAPAGGCAGCQGCRKNG